MKEMYRQGDVMLVKVEGLPEAKTRKAKRCVLAEGEVTGHFHVLEADLLETTDLEKRFVQVLSEGGVLTHDEHDTIPVPPGVYEIRRQREYSPEEVRWVSD